MPSVCCYLQVHQPLRVRIVDYFDGNKDREYFDQYKNKVILEKVASRSYLPTIRLLNEMIHKHDGKFRFALSFTGLVLEQMEKWTPQVLEGFKQLHRTGCVEILSETYHHSLASLFSATEFKEQVTLHAEIVERLFGAKPTVFRNTELIYSDRIGEMVFEMGYKGVVAEGADQVLRGRSPNNVYRHPTRNLGLLLKNYQLSDDIAFRFNNKKWEHWPLTADKYANWIFDRSGQTVNLFMDFETFGEHQTGRSIFDFLRHFPEEILRKRNFSNGTVSSSEVGAGEFLTPTEVLKKYAPTESLMFSAETSWADLDRDLSAWRGNSMQERALTEIYGLESMVLKRNNPLVLDVWRGLQASDHFYYMCTKWFSDGDVHAYFSPYQSPYEAFLSYMGAVEHLKETVLRT